jgi:enamine deaminase RidA (YjgF/YER057c/UK114 family)
MAALTNGEAVQKASHQILQPEGWARPIGYSNGISARGRLVFVSGQVGWDAECRFVSDDLVQQIAQALRNIVDVVKQAGGGPEHITALTWFVTNVDEYKRARKEIGKAYREIMGSHYPTMSVLQVVGFVETDAKVEIQAFAVVPD